MNIFGSKEKWESVQGWRLGRFPKEWDEDQTPLASTAGRILPKLRSDPREVSMIIGVVLDTPEGMLYQRVHK